MPVIKSLRIPFFLMTFLLAVSTPVSATVVPGFSDIQVGSEPGAVGIVEYEYRNHSGGISRIHDYAYDSNVKNTDVE